MATNRGAYDPRHLLHYPDKNPFSDESQKRLDDLVNDFLRTGLAFVNGASVDDITVQERRRIEPNTQGLNGFAELEEVSSPKANELDAVDEDDEQEDELFRVDKGKGRDEREGPGLQGLWGQRTAQANLASPQQGFSVDDAISLSSGSDPGHGALEDVEPEDGDGSFIGETYGEGNLAGGMHEDDAYQQDGSESGTDLGSMNSRGPSSEQEIIYIGDSDEDEPGSQALSDEEPERNFESHSMLPFEEAEDNGFEHASGSEFDEAEDQSHHHDVWPTNHEDDEGGVEGHEWQHHSQGKESDEDEGPGYREWEVDSKREHPQMREANTNPAARHFFSPSPLFDPWVSSSFGQASKTSLSSVRWEHQSHLTTRQEPERMGDGEFADREEELTLGGFKSLSQNLHSDQLNTLQPLGLEQHSEQSITPSFLATPGSDIDGHPVPPPQTSIPEPNTLISISGSDHTDFQQHEESGREDIVLISNDGEGNENLLPSASSDLPQHHPIPAPDIIAHEEAISNPQAFASLIPATDGAPAMSMLSSSIGYPALPLPSTDSSEMLDFLDLMPPAELSNTDMSYHPDAGKTQASVHATGTSYSSQADDTGLAQARPENDALFDDFPGSSGPPTEPILHDATFTGRENGNRRLIHSNIEMTMEDSTVDDVRIRHSPTIPNVADVSSNELQKEQNVDEDDEPISLGLPGATGETTLSISRGEESNPAAGSRPAVFDDHQHDLVDAEDRSPSPKTANVVSARPDDHSTDEIPHGNGLVHEQSDVTQVPLKGHEVNEESGEQELVVEVIPERDPRLESDAPPDYIVEEITSQDGEVRTASLDADAAVSEVAEVEKVDLIERPAALGAIPTISIGSSTPPLSPTATVTNCSSVPDQSVATSDLSTVNQATVSVVTSTSSPPPIHVPRPSPTPADIRQPHGSRVGFASEEEEEENILPDPRLPPEPTHLRIPVGVVSRGLNDDKEELAESVKVEPPTPHVRSESEDGSIRDVGEVPSPEAKVVTEEGAKDLDSSEKLEVLVPEEREGSTGSVDLAANEEKRSHQEEPQWEAANLLPELTYPDSDSEHLSKGDRTSPLADELPGGLSSSSDPAHPVLDSSLDILKPTPGDTSSTTPQNGDVSRPPEVDEGRILNNTGQTYDQNNDPFVDTNGHAGLIHNGDVLKDAQHTLSKESPEPTDRPVTPTVSEGGSPDKIKQSPRSSTKGRAKGKGKASASVDTKSEEYPPQSTIHVQGRASAARKRSRESDSGATPSKQRRITRSAAARSLSIGDGTSPSVVSDDKSDVSSIASSSSAVSRILRPKPSSFVSMSSRSPSIVSQSSPTGSMAPPIRPYVPHNHSYHAPAPPISTPHRLTPVPRIRQSISPSPTPSQPSTSTHLTRASCTDHKISIPGVNGRMLYFLIPRCSLLEPEVEKDESIVDCGVATSEEVKRAIGDIEAVGLDAEILGVIRQLAGVQLMREGQVGYLPSPHERIRRRGKPMRSHLVLQSPTQGLTPQVEITHHPSQAKSSLSPLSRESTSPASTSGSAASEMGEEVDTGGHRRRRSKAFDADDEVYEPSPDAEEDEEESAHDEEGAVPPPPPSSPKPVHVTKSARPRKRGLRTDDAAYKPDNNDAESSSDFESSGARKKGKGTRKRRQSEASTQAESASATVVEGGRTSSKKKRKRKDAELAADLEASQEDALGPSRKKPRRKTNGSLSLDGANSPV